MIRLRRDDFDDDLTLSPLAKQAGLSNEAFRQQFEYLVVDESEPLHLVRP